MKLVALLSSLFIITACARAGETFTTITGQQFTDVTIAAVEPDGLKLVTDAGIVKLPFRDLSPDIQKRYHYDPAAAAQYAAAVHQGQAANSQRAQAEWAQAQTAKAGAEIQLATQQAQADATRQIAAAAFQADIRIKQIFAHGALAEVTEYKGAGSLRHSNVFIAGLTEGVDNTRLHATLYPAGRYQYDDVAGAARTVRAFAMTPAAALEYAAKHP